MRRRVGIVAAALALAAATTLAGAQGVRGDELSRALDLEGAGKMREAAALFKAAATAPNVSDDTRTAALLGLERAYAALGQTDSTLVALAPALRLRPQDPTLRGMQLRSLRSLGKTVLLTTHYLDEAEQLSDRVAVMREGRVVRVGTPRELTTGDRETEIRYRQNGEEVLVLTDEPTRVLAELTSAAVARGEELEGLQVRRPSLEEVYLALTAEEDEAAAEVET